MTSRSTENSTSTPAARSSRSGIGRPTSLRGPTCGALSIARSRTAQAIISSRRSGRWPNADSVAGYPRASLAILRRVRLCRRDAGPSTRMTVTGRSMPAATSRFCCTAICAACRRRWRIWRFGPKLPMPFSVTFSISYQEHHRRIFEASRRRIDLTYVAEDLGSQTRPADEPGHVSPLPVAEPDQDG